MQNIEQDILNLTWKITFLLSHLEGINRLFGSGAFDNGCFLSSHTNQST